MSASEETNDESVVGPEKVDDGPRAGRTPDGGHPVPLFLRDLNDGRKGDAQDEKDETGE
jgi:hypothetical protein